ncbi:MAG TPA: hypothetical protein VHM93_16550 [Candidatus Acidoferrum sp.]|jgi:hypothetical protein|nr:hypothetical protein [Candidatus Acidoferrum sp.]
MKRTFYKCLLWLHPAAFRDRFAEEMLWIFDESGGQGPGPFTDVLISLLRQWTFDSGVWKIAFGALASCLLLTGWWHFQEAALASTLRRGNPGVLEVIKHRHPTGMPCSSISGDGVEASETETGPTGSQGDTQPCDVADAIQGIVAAFQHHPVVMIGEVHWLQPAGDFYGRLIRDRKFQETVEDIVVEFASRNNQRLLDRYIAGEDVPIEEVRHIWRDTTKVASWESPIYAQWLARIRDVNQGLPPNRRLRVLAGDTAVDWQRIRTHADWEALPDSNASFADVIVNEVLRRGHRALVVLGTNHVTKSDDRNGNEDTTTRVESRYPGSTYVVLLDNRGLLQPPVEELVRLHQLPQNASILCELAGTPLGDLAANHAPPLANQADALLYLGPPETLTRAFPPAASLEPAYMKEVDRRSMIECGELRDRKLLGAAAE